MTLFKRLIFLLILSILFVAFSSSKQVSAATTTRDLTITAFTFPGGVDTGTSNPTIKIKNVENANITGNFVVKVITRTNGTGTTKTTTVSGIGQGSEIDLSQFFTGMQRPDAGTYTAQVTVDINNSIVESNENNNSKTSQYTTTAPTTNCTQAAQTVTVTPNNRKGDWGIQKSYSISFTNKDKGSDCTPDNFTMSVDSGPHLSGAFDKTQFTNVAPGETKTATLTVKPVSGDGTKTLQISVKGVQAKHPKVTNSTATFTINHNGTGPTAEPTKKPTTPPTPVTGRDLVVSAFIFPGGLDSGTSNPTIAIKNNGTANITGNFVVTVENRPNGGTKSYTVQGIGSGSTINLSQFFTNMPRPSAGNYTAKATVDSGGAISETNENNNTKTDQYTTSATTPTSSTCVRQAPTLTFNPEHTANVNAGATKTYTVTVHNNDSEICTPSAFAFTASLLGGNDNWKFSFAPTSQTVQPIGGTKNTILSVTSPAGATKGVKKIQVTATDRTNNRTATGQVRYCVGQACGSLTPTPTGHPTAIPTEPTGKPGQTKLKLSIGLDGIGDTPRIPKVFVEETGENGEIKKVSVGANQNPKHPNRTLRVIVQKAGSNASPLFDKNETFSFNSTSGKFDDTITLPNTTTTDVYNVYVSGPPFVRGQYPNSVRVVKGTTSILNSGNFYLVTGNTNDKDQSENQIGLVDYNVLISCSILSLDNHAACNQDQNYSTFSDLNDDGAIDEVDYNLWLKEISVQSGVNIPPGGDIVTPAPTTTSCIRKAPVIALTDGKTTLGAKPGKSVTYKVTVTNKNKGCGQVKFNVTASPRNVGFTWKLANDNPMISDGDTKPDHLTVTSAANAKSGDQSVIVLSAAQFATDPLVKTDTNLKYVVK